MEERISHRKYYLGAGAADYRHIKRNRRGNEHSYRLPGHLLNRLFGVPFGAGQFVSGLHVFGLFWWRDW